MTDLTLRGTWLTPDRGRDLLVVGPSLGTGVVALWDTCAQVVAARGDVDVLGWDLPGHGDGAPVDDPFTVEDLAAAVVRLAGSVRPGHAFAYAGVSVGGVVGLALATGAAPVSAVCVICSDAKVGTPEGWHERADLVRRAGTPVMVTGSVQRWFAPGFVERQPSVTTGLLTTLQHADKNSYARVCEALADADLRPGLAGIEVPVLVVAGRHDAVCTPEDGEALVAAVPGAQLVVIEDAAHLAPAESPTEVGEVVADWLHGIPETDRTARQTHAAGMKVRREVLSDAHVDGAEARKSALTHEFQDLITRYAWGEIWTRPGLDRRMRSAITLTALIAHGHWGELEMHVRAARRNGLSREEIAEVLLQSAVYLGVPAANHAFGIAQRVLDEEDAG